MNTKSARELFDSLNGTLDPQISGYIKKQKKRLHPNEKQVHKPGSKSTVLHTNTTLVKDKPSALNIFPTINNTKKGRGSLDRFETQINREQQYVKEKPLGEQFDQQKPYYNKFKYEIKEHMDDYQRSKNMLVHRKAVVIKANK